MRSLAMLPDLLVQEASLPFLHPYPLSIIALHVRQDHPPPCPRGRHHGPDHLPLPPRLRWRLQHHRRRRPGRRCHHLRRRYHRLLRVLLLPRRAPRLPGGLRLGLCLQRNRQLLRDRDHLCCVLPGHYPSTPRQRLDVLLGDWRCCVPHQRMHPRFGPFARPGRDRYRRVHRCELRLQPLGCLQQPGHQHQRFLCLLFLRYHLRFWVPGRSPHPLLQQP
mmetsp:Transcript_19474/g.48602  ORF Transcript_19474/g.48602 Transcript_19474/m.48602 type:complete len:219 (-) Transcript_19474:252-908(-)